MNVAELSKEINKMAHRHDLWSIWCDWLLMCATSFANAADKRPAVCQEREDQYMRVVKKYSKEEVDNFAHLFRVLIDTFPHPNGEDVLGQTFMNLELGNKWGGQFFTPDSVCGVMGACIFDKLTVSKAIAERGCVTLSEPSVGGGATVIGFANAMHKEGFNPQQQLHVTAVDIDIKSVHMAFIQLTLMGIPAVIIHGNTLTLEEWSHWYTPAHIMGGWNYRLKRKPEVSFF